MGQKYATVDTDGMVTGFYDEDWNGQHIPSDAIAITEEAHALLLAGQDVGKVMHVLPDGTPRLADPPTPSKEALAAMASAKRETLLREAGERIAPLQDAVDLDMATDEDRAALNAWRRYRVQLSRVDVTAPEWPLSPDAPAPELPEDDSSGASEDVPEAVPELGEAPEDTELPAQNADDDAEAEAEAETETV